jgi:hypothetical protein
MDPDMNNYDTEHAVTAHPRMSKKTLEAVYRDAWASFYTPEHMETIMRRAGATGVRMGSLPGTLLHFSLFTKWEKVHPLQGGLLRLKYRRDRRLGRPIEPIWKFYPKILWESAQKLSVFLSAAVRLERLKRSIRRDPNRAAYTDQAITL